MRNCSRTTRSMRSWSTGNRLATACSSPLEFAGACRRCRLPTGRRVELRKPVALGEQIQDATRVGHEAFVAERLHVGRHWMFVSENQDGQIWWSASTPPDHCLARARKRQSMNIKAWWLRRIAGQQAFDRRPIRADETLTRIFRIGETRLSSSKRSRLTILSILEEERRIERFPLPRGGIAVNESTA